MNNNFVNQSGFPGNPLYTGGQVVPNQQTQVNFPDTQFQQSYIENILRLNKGKIASFYMSYPDSNEWRDKIFTGRVEQAARDHVVVFDPKNGKWYLLLSIYLNFIVFDEEINYKVI